jgi:transposase
MISRETVFEIHRLSNEGYSSRKIGRLLGIGRNTVARYLKNPEKVYKPRKKRRSKLDSFKPVIDEYLKKDPTVCAPVILRKIRDKGYSGGITILHEYLKKTRGQTKNRTAFIRFESEPGEDFQIDWGHFGAIMYGNSNRKLYALAVIESYSRMLYIEFTHSQRQEVLHGCLFNAFKYFGGTPQKIVVDNMVTAVISRTGHLVRFNDAFLDFLRPFHIIPRACNIRAPFEKGNGKLRIMESHGFLFLHDTDILRQFYSI